MGRVKELRKELTRLERAYTIRHRKRDNNGHFIEVEISNAASWSKFFVGFELHYGYPYGDLKFSFKNLFGNVTYDIVEQTIRGISPGFGRLTKICAALKNI